jgi:hypothetical protein
MVAALVAGCDYVVHLAPGLSSDPGTITCVTEGAHRARRLS